MSISAYAGTSDTGRKRRINEDSFVIAPPLFAVADGMGGAQAGEIASALAAGALEESGADGGGERRVAELIQEANSRVHERATTDAATAGMGTTITAALVEPDGRVVFGHVGDSRAYLLRNDTLEQLTNDHTLVAELVRRGELSPGEAQVQPCRPTSTRASSRRSPRKRTRSIRRMASRRPRLPRRRSTRWSCPRPTSRRRSRRVKIRTFRRQASVGDCWPCWSSWP